MIAVNNKRVKERVKKLSDIIRAEYIDDVNYLELYAGIDTIESVYSIKNQIIYGRRGTGKTHLLKALQEQLIGNFYHERRMPIYIDLRRLLPLITYTNNTIEFSILVFKQIVNEIFNVIVENINFLYRFNEFDNTSKCSIIKKNELDKMLEDINIKFDGQEYKKLEEIELNEEEIKKLALSLKISQQSELGGSREKESTISTSFKKSRYISFADITEIINKIPDLLDVKRFICLIDEWSEVPLDTQVYIAELIKRGFITSKFTFKVAAITNRSKIGRKIGEDFVGLEDGGDIFPFNLDNRFVYEINSQKTKDFFSDLLYKHLSSIDNKFQEHIFEGLNSNNFLNYFLANQALREILIAAAGIPRDFINLFINAYDQFILNTSNGNKRIGVKHIRLATIDWYKTDKKEQVDNISNCKVLLEGIINEIVTKKKKTHFLIPQKYSNNEYLNQLIDFRVIHLRKKGYSHKGNKGVVYDVYSVDYGCYTSIEVHQSKLDIDFINRIDSIDNFRDIRRVSLEGSFFDDFILNIGESFYCPHCGKPVDINHPAYKKRKLCNHCFENAEKTELIDQTS